MKFAFTIIVSLISFFGIAQNETLFNEATAFYNEGDYEKAITNYHKIVENGEHSAAVYFNLGDAYYKLNQAAPSIYYYEKALLLAPGDVEIKSNLSFAQNMTLDAIEVLPETGFSKIYRGVIGFLSFEQWSYLAIALVLIFVFSYIAFYFFSYATKKRIAFITSMFAMVFAVLAVILAYLQFEELKSYNPAIVFADETVIQSEPNDRSQENFRLHEGTKVNVLDQLNDWKKIRIADGKTGWVNAADIKLLKDF